MSARLRSVGHSNPRSRSSRVLSQCPALSFSARPHARFEGRWSGSRSSGSVPLSLEAICMSRADSSTGFRNAPPRRLHAGKRFAVGARPNRPAPDRARTPPGAPYPVQQTAPPQSRFPVAEQSDPGSSGSGFPLTATSPPGLVPSRPNRVAPRLCGHARPRSRGRRHGSPRWPPGGRANRSGCSRALSSGRLFQTLSAFISSLTRGEMK